MERTKVRWKKFLNSGYDKDIYEKNEREITSLNKRMVKGTSFLGSIMMLLLTAAALAVSSINKVLPLYFETMLLFVAIYAVVKIEKKENHKVILVCNYVFLSVAFVFSIGLDMIQKNTTATTVCVLLVALPLLIVDKPWREAIFFLCVTFAFVLEVVFVKANSKAPIDILNAFSFYAIGQYLGYRHNQLMLSNIEGHNLLQTQRDRDSLTSLYNKGAIETRAGEYLGLENSIASLIVIDMDDFKHVNDTYGHHAGDDLLRSVAKVLQSTFRATDIISRFGGDEFTIFLPMTNDKEVLQRKAEQILEKVHEIRITEDPDYRAHICMGIAVYPESGKNYEELFRKADSALYSIKKNGKNGYKIYNPDSKKTILLVDDVEVNRASLHAILENEFEVLEAENGSEALSILESGADIQLVITDIQMPQMDGVELIRHIRANPRLDTVSIIANTQYGDMVQEAEVYALGINDFMYKPASPEAVQLRVRNIMKADHAE